MPQPLEHSLRLLAALGDANNVQTWSGTPYYFLQAARRLNVIDAGLQLDPSRLNVQGRIWNLRSFLRTGKARGWYFTEQFHLNLIEQSGLTKNDDITLVSHFPLLPPEKYRARWRVYYYIDATLEQLFHDYGFGRDIDPALQRDAKLREASALQSAERVFCMSTWAASSVIRDCGVASEKCVVVRPGANIDENAICNNPSRSAPSVPIQTLRLGLIGSDWKRKGLPLLLKVAERLVSRGIPTEVWTIGASPSNLPKHPLLRSIGFLDKKRDVHSFIDIVQRFHFGCLFSSAEAFGISLLECLRLGVPAIGTEVGGIVDAIPKGLGFTVPAGIKENDIADRIEFYVRNPDEYYKLREAVAMRAHDFTWDRSAHVIGRYLEMPGDDHVT